VIFLLVLKCFEIYGGNMLSLSRVSVCGFCFLFIFFLCCEVFWEMMPKIQTEAPALLNYYLHVSLIPNLSWLTMKFLIKSK